MEAPVATPGHRQLDRGHRPPRRREARRHRRVRRPPRALRAGRSAPAHPGDAPEPTATTTRSSSPSRCTPPAAAPTPSSTSTTLRFGYTSLVTPQSVFDYDMDARDTRADEAAAGARRLRPGRYVSERLWATARRRRARADLARLPPGHAGRRHRAVPALRLRLLRDAASTRRSPRSGSACSTAASSSPSPTSAAAARWAAAGTTTASCCTSATRSPTSSPCAEHLVADELHVDRPAGDPRRQRRRPADGRGGEPAARPVQGRRRRGPVRRLPRHDPRRDPPAHRHRVGGVGQPARPPRSTTT